MRTSGETNSPPGQPNSIWAGSGEGEKLIKRGAKTEPLASLLFETFESASPRASRMHFPLLAK